MAFRLQHHFYKLQKYTNGEWKRLWVHALLAWPAHIRTMQWVNAHSDCVQESGPVCTCPVGMGVEKLTSYAYARILRRDVPTRSRVYHRCTIMLILYHPLCRASQALTMLLVALL